MNTHWWDGSQIYGATTAEQAALRLGRDGKLLVGPGGRLGVDPDSGREITGFTDNMWVGLSLLHGLFALEHNAACGMLRRHNRHWDDERLFQQARLITSAPLAKIHTVEWTPAILPHPVTQLALRANWYGLARNLQKVLRRAERSRAGRRHPGLADGNDLEKVDLLAGLMAEPLPEGFGFSETAFRVFILMASRRLESDRFLSKDYREEVYTRQGIKWVEDNSMIDVLTRHFPAVAPALKKVENAFHPWRPVTQR